MEKKGAIDSYTTWALTETTAVEETDQKNEEDVREKGEKGKGKPKGIGEGSIAIWSSAWGDAMTAFAASAMIFSIVLRALVRAACEVSP